MRMSGKVPRRREGDGRRYDRDSRAGASTHLRLDGIRRLPAARPYLVRRAGRPSRLLPRRIRQAPPMARRSDLRRPGGAVSVSAGPGEQPGDHGGRAHARRLSWHAGGLDRLHHAVGDCDAGLRLWRRGNRWRDTQRLAARPESRRRGGGGAGGARHDALAGARPPARDPCRRGRGRRSGLSHRLGTDRCHLVRCFDRRGAAEERQRACEPDKSADHDQPLDRRGLAGVVPGTARRAAAVGREHAEPRSQPCRRLLSRRLAGVRRRPRGAAAAASLRGAARLGEQRRLPRRLRRGAGTARAAVRVCGLSRRGDGPGAEWRRSAPPSASSRSTCRRSS